MNTNTDLLGRLLRLFPVKFIKTHFNVTDVVQDDIIASIIQHNTQTVIKNFALNYINNTKQHIYLFSLNKNFNRNKFDATSFPLSIVKEVASGTSYEFRCLPIVDFNAVILNPFEEPVVKYYQPTVISITGKQMIIQCTILEKNLLYLFGKNRKVVDLTKANDEEKMIYEVVSYFEQEYGVIVTDINKGVKKLWDTDIIDSKFAKWKKTRSSATEAMDEGYTLKTQYPELYTNLISSPLNKTIFKYLHSDDKFCPHFTADATKGQLSVPLYPDTEHQIKNIINEILANN